MDDPRMPVLDQAAEPIVSDPGVASPVASRTDLAIPVTFPDQVNHPVEVMHDPAVVSQPEVSAQPVVGEPAPRQEKVSRGAGELEVPSDHPQPQLQPEVATAPERSEEAVVQPSVSGVASVSEEARAAVDPTMGGRVGKMMKFLFMGRSADLVQRGKEIDAAVQAERDKGSVG